MDDSIRAALALYEAHDHDEALQMLLACWTDVPNPELAAVIEQLSHRPGLERLGGRTRAQRRRQWLEVAADESPHDVPRLLAALRDLSCAHATELLGHVAAWPGSPVIAQHLLAYVADPPDGFQGSNKLAFWDKLLELLYVSADPRMEPRLRELAPKVPRGFALGDYLPERLEALADHLATVPSELPADELVACRALAQRVSASGPGEDLTARADTLLQEVYDNPEDDDVRRVLADVLTELGDPRGEFIVLQFHRETGDMTKEMRARERALLVGYGRAWLGGIDKAVGKSDLKYRRGFPAEGKVDLREVDDPTEILARPEWNTFESLDAGWGAAPLLQRGDLKVLRTVTRAPPEVFETDAVLAIEYLELLGNPSPSQLEAAGRVMPKLTTLDLGDCRRDLARHLWRPNPLPQRLVRLSVYTGFAPWLAEVAQADPPVDELHIGGYALRVVVRRTEAGVLDHLEVTCTSEYHEQTYAESLARDLGGAELSFARRLSVHYDVIGEITEPERREVETVLRRLGAPEPS